VAGEIIYSAYDFMTILGVEDTTERMILCI